MQRSRTIGARIKSFLIRHRQYALLAAVASLYSVVKTGRFVRVKYDGLWSHYHSDHDYSDRDYSGHDHRGMVIVDRNINFIRPRDWLATVETNWGLIYKPRPGDVVVDVGAGIGGETYYYSKAVGPQGHVVAIEAHPQTFAALSRFCQLNALNNVTCLNVAVTDKRTQVTISDNVAHAASSIYGAGGGWDVDGLPLDEIVQQLDLKSIAFLKMNIEGAERPALHGMAHTLQITDCLCISCHDFIAERDGDERFRTKDDVAAFLATRGYELVERTGEYLPYIRDQVNAINSERAGRPAAPSVSPPNRA